MKLSWSAISAAASQSRAAWVHATNTQLLQLELPRKVLHTYGGVNQGGCCSKPEKCTTGATQKINIPHVSVSPLVCVCSVCECVQARVGNMFTV